MADGHYFDLLGPFQLLKPFFYNEAFKEVTCTVKGLKIGSDILVAQSISAN
jgi:hypothetical protein